MELLTVNINISMIMAVIAAEALSMFWYSDRTPWGRRQADRYFITALLADIGLAIILQIMMRKHLAVYGLGDAVMLAGGLTMVYVCLEAPHAVWSSRSLNSFFLHSLHKFAVILVMVLVLWILPKY